MNLKPLLALVLVLVLAQPVLAHPVSNYAARGVVGGGCLHYTPNWGCYHYPPPNWGCYGSNYGCGNFGCGNSGWLFGIAAVNTIGNVIVSQSQRPVAYVAAPAPPPPPVSAPEGPTPGASLPYGYFTAHGTIRSPWSTGELPGGGLIRGQILYDPYVGRPFVVPSGS